MGVGTRCALQFVKLTLEDVNNIESRVTREQRRAHCLITAALPPRTLDDRDRSHNHRCPHGRCCRCRLVVCVRVLACWRGVL